MGKVKEYYFPEDYGMDENVYVEQGRRIKALEKNFEILFADIKKIKNFLGGSIVDSSEDNLENTTMDVLYTDKPRIEDEIDWSEYDSMSDDLRNN
jgi:hypothetical protein